jgi:hypothetical protein
MELSRGFHSKEYMYCSLLGTGTMYFDISVLEKSLASILIPYSKWMYQNPF